MMNEKHRICWFLEKKKHNEKNFEEKKLFFWGKNLAKKFGEKIKKKNWRKISQKFSEKISVKNLAKNLAKKFKKKFGACGAIVTRSKFP